MKQQRLADVLAGVLLTSDFRMVHRVSFTRITNILEQLWPFLEQAYKDTGVARVAYRNVRAIGNPVRILTVPQWEMGWGLEEYLDYVTRNLPDTGTVLRVDDHAVNGFMPTETKLIENPAKLDVMRPLMEFEKTGKGLPEA